MLSLESRRFPVEVPAEEELTMNSTLLDCPDCEYQCSPSALSCLNCGRIFRVSQVVDAPPRTNLVLWVAALLTASVAGFLAIGSVLNTTPKNAEFGATESGSESTVKQTVVESRRRFALRVQEAVLENPSKYPTDFIFTTEDYLEKSDTLVVTGGALVKKDCDRLASGDDGQAAASLGFNRVVCRNRRLRNEWALQLERTKF